MYRNVLERYDAVLESFLELAQVTAYVNHMAENNPMFRIARDRAMRGGLSGSGRGVGGAVGGVMQTNDADGEEAWCCVPP